MSILLGRTFLLEFKFRTLKLCMSLNISTSLQIKKISTSLQIKKKNMRGEKVERQYLEPSNLIS